jgi:hypothetical protein
LLARLDTSYL